MNASAQMGTRPLRLIPRLDIKMEWLIKGVQMEGWRKVGSPQEFARRYYEQGADEIIFMDVVASLYERNNLSNIVEKCARDVFVPMTVGGGIRNLEDVAELLAVGADKVIVNTAATQDPDLISRISDRYGAQATVVAIEAQRKDGRWIAMTDNGRNHTGLDVIEWASTAESKGAGEVMVTCIDTEGTGRGLELPLIEQIAENLSIPVIASGGVGETGHVADAFKQTRCTAVAMAQALHWDKVSLPKMREELSAAGVSTRLPMKVTK